MSAILRILGGTLAISVALSAPPAHAVSVHMQQYVQAYSAAGSQDHADSYDSGLLPQATISNEISSSAAFSLGPSIGFTTADATSRGAVTADGAFHFFLSASSHTPNGAIYNVNAFAGISMHSEDVFTISSASLPLGTAVELDLVLFMENANVHSPSDGTNSAQFTGSWILNGPTTVALSVARSSCCEGFIPAQSSPTYQLFASVGDQFSVNMTLTASVSGGAQTGTDASSGIDGSHTGFLNITPTTPGVTIVSDAGYRYDLLPTAVPEPSTMLLLGSCLAGLAALRRSSGQAWRRKQAPNVGKCGLREL